MFNIRHIIEAATPGPWHIEVASWNSDWFKGTPLIKGGYPERHITAVDSGYKREDNANSRFIATFDSEHVALMETVCEAAWSSADEGRLHDALTRLYEYRKENGYV